MPVLSEILSADPLSVLKLMGICIAAFLIFGWILRALFGKNSPLIRATSAGVTVTMVYLSVILFYLVPPIREMVPELPCLTVTKDAFYLWNPTELASTILFPNLLRLFVLAVIANSIDSHLPKGKTLLSWYIIRMAGVCGVAALYMLVCWAADTWAPRIFGDLAQPILLGLWGFILLTGLIRWLMTLVLTAMNPVVGVLYGIFFRNPTGQQLSKSILTTLLVLSLIVFLCGTGFGSFAFSSFSFAAYGPTCLAGMVLMYLFGRLL